MGFELYSVQSGPVRLRSSCLAPPCTWPPPATIRPDWGTFQMAELRLVEPFFWPPGMSNTGSALQFSMSSQ